MNNIYLYYIFINRNYLEFVPRIYGFRVNKDSPYFTTGNEKAKEELVLDPPVHEHDHSPTAMNGKYRVTADAVLLNGELSPGGGSGSGNGLNMNTQQNIQHAGVSGNRMDVVQPFPPVTNTNNTNNNASVNMSRGGLSANNNTNTNQTSVNQMNQNSFSYPSSVIHPGNNTSFNSYANTNTNNSHSSVPSGGVTNISNPYINMK